VIGRDEVISRISSQLTYHRLITLVGTGGIGKTSVAVATAERLANNYEHGVWFVDLTAIEDPGLLPAAISSSVGLDGRATRRARPLQERTTGAPPAGFAEHESDAVHCKRCRTLLTSNRPLRN
jgi:predicted ATPase